MRRHRLKGKAPRGASFLYAGMRGAVAVALLFGAQAPAFSQSMKVRASGFSDVSFGTVLNLQTTSRRPQNLCVYANSNGERYSVRATGSGPGGAFVLYDGPNALTYGVEWSSSSGQSSGTSVNANTPLTGQVSTANNQNCNSGPPTTASLIIALRPSDLGSAIQGNYSGTLSVTVSPE